jgi:hypothetical protein
MKELAIISLGFALMAKAMGLLKGLDEGEGELAIEQVKESFLEAMKGVIDEFEEEEEEEGKE